MTRVSLPMARLALWMPLAMALFIAVAGTWLLQAGLVPGQVSSGQGALVGQALLGATDKVDAGIVLASYPPFALLPLIALLSVSNLAGFAAADLLAAVIAAALAGTWLRGMLRAGYRPLTATGLVLLLCLNPLFLRAMAEGPELLLTLGGAYAFAISAFAVRGRGGVNDLMLCSGSLVLMAFAGQSGMLLAIATIPFLLLIIPSDIRARSWSSVYLVLLFPVLFALLGFALVNWMMLHDPLAFVRPQVETSGEWFAGSWRLAMAEIVSSAASAPILIGLFILARGRRPVQAVAAALIGTVMLLALLALQTGVGLSLTAALSPAVGLAAAAAMRWPVQQHRAIRTALLLALGCFGGASALMAESYAYTSGSEIHADRRDAADRRLGLFLQGRTGVLIDAAAHPQVVAARGSAAGLVTSGETGFEIAMLKKRVRGVATAVAAAAPDPSRNADRVGRILPNVYARGEPGFRLIYDRDGWRVWSSEPQAKVTR